MLKGKVDNKINIEENIFSTGKIIKKFKEVKMENHVLTESDYDYAVKMANHINKSYPGQAWIEDNCCVISANYWNMCKAYVQENCRILPNGEPELE